MTYRLPLLVLLACLGLSAHPIFGETYGDPDRPFVIDKGLGLVDFALLPHVDPENHPESTMAKVESMAAEVQAPTYAIDDQTAIKVVTGEAAGDDAVGAVEVISEGHWKRFPGK